MSLEEIKRREAYHKEFGQILVRRHGQNYHSSFQNAKRITTDDTAARFGRYLRAARTNAGLAPEELATLVNLSKARLTALEQGVILACDIKPKWLKELAGALEENYEDFNLILGRQISSGNSRWLIERLISQCRNWLLLSKSSILSKPLYAATSAAIVIFLVIGSVSIFEIDSVGQPSPQRDLYSFIDVAPDRRLNMVKAEAHLGNQLLFLSTEPDRSTKGCCLY